ncbi:hypothetical protein B4153_3577 [Bacillus cereus]|jgi:hypothetical protein|nr:hypothetical protein B4153_3577 [Bacillus cereus]KYQ02182.1 hypothetical protein B4079_2709 [Bacillus cereus]
MLSSKSILILPLDYINYKKKQKRDSNYHKYICVSSINKRW